jgi:hypothetical protein
MKRNGSQWNIDDIKCVFKKRFSMLRGKRAGEYRSKFAVIWFVDAPQKITYRVVDEEEFDYLLQNRYFAQYIAAVQLYFGGYPLKGSGWFEHRVWTDDRQKEFHQTNELVAPPQQPEYLDLNKFISNVNSVIQLGQDRPAARGNIPEEPHRLIITEAQHEYLRPVVQRLLHYMRLYTHCHIVDATFMFGFNSTWAPFVLGVRGVQLRDVPQSVSLMRHKMFASFDSMFTRDMQLPTSLQLGEAGAGAGAGAGQQGVAPVKAEQPHDHKTPHLKKISRYDSMDVIPSFNYGGTSSAADVPFSAQDSAEFGGDPTDPDNIPKPTAALRMPTQGVHAGNVDYGKREEVPTATSGAKLSNALPSGAASTTPAALVSSVVDPRAVGGGGGGGLLDSKSAMAGGVTTSALQDYALAYGIGFRTGQMTDDTQREERQKTIHQNIMKDFQTEKGRGTLGSAAIASKTQAKYGEGRGGGGSGGHRYAMITNNWSRRVKAYPSMVRGSQDESWEDFRCSLRPLSAAPSRGQAMLARTTCGYVLRCAVLYVLLQDCPSNWRCICLYAV